MPLVDLKTNLKSLKYGSDQIGGGNSGQPFIQFPIEDKNTPKSFLEFYQSNRTSLDFPIRGGGLDYNIKTSTFTKSSEIDKERIKKFLVSKPRGAAFIEKQVGLQLSNPKIQTGPALYAFGSFLSTVNIAENTRVYNLGKNTLAQVGFSGTGIHANRHGITPFDSNAKYYSDIVGSEINLDSEEVANKNRLLILQQLKMGKGNNLSSNTITSNINEVNRLGLSLNKNLLFDYLGGPGSVYGIGKTIIKRYVDTRDAITKTGNLAAPGARSYDDIANIETKKKYSYITGPEINLDSKEVANKNRLLILQKSKMLTPSIDTDKRYVDTRDAITKTGNLAAPPVARSYDDIANTGISILDSSNSLRKSFMGSREATYHYNVGKKNKSDKIGSESFPIGIFSSDDPWKSEDISQKDMIKFGFECINNDNTTQSTFLQFRAYLDGAITDSNQGSWNSFKYMGRGEDFYSYQGFSRTIGFSFKLVTHSEEELLNMHNKLTFLVSQVYPDYSPLTNMMRAPIVRLTIGDYLYRTPGILESVNLTIDQTSPWEINLDNNLAQLPQYIGVSLSFKPIPDSLPKRKMMPLKNKLSLINSEELRQERNNRMQIENNQLNKNINSTPNITILTPFIIPNNQNQNFLGAPYKNAIINK